MILNSLTPEAQVMVLSLTCMNSLVAGQVALVAEGSLAAVTLVWLVTVDLGHVVFQGIFITELGVTTIAEVGVVFCQNMCSVTSLQNNPIS